MEHRLHRRDPVDLMVRLVNAGQVVATVRAVDMSLGGLGIESPIQMLNSGQSVGVDLCRSGYPRGVNCYKNALVIHTGSKVTGLMFTSESPLRTVLQPEDVEFAYQYEPMAMIKDVGTPASEARTSPIVEESDEEFDLLMQAQEDQAYCYFNNVAYDDGSFVCSGSGEQLHCEKGVWIRESGCDVTNP